MSILTDVAIKAAMQRGELVIEPFEPRLLGTNSYDVTLNPVLAEYDFTYNGTRVSIVGETNESFDTRQPAPPLIYTEIPTDGLWLYPNRLYLGVTNERTYTPCHVPIMHGKSSLGRFGVDIHICAGFGDIGFGGTPNGENVGATWTLEIRVMRPTKVYAGMKIAQIAFHIVAGEIGTAYNEKASAKYTVQGNAPVGSKYHENFGDKAKLSETDNV